MAPVRDGGLPRPPAAGADAGGGGGIGGSGPPSSAGDGGSIFVPELDAGAPFPADAGPGEVGDAGADADSGADDAGADADSGADDAGDGDPPDGQAPCTASSTARSADGCSGQLCDTTLAALTGSVSQGACSQPAALALACDGQLARSAALCAQASTSSLWFDNAVRGCLRSDRALGDVSSDCRDCYADELLCTLSHCLVACVAELAQECTACRALHCGSAFSACSGVSAP